MDESVSDDVRGCGAVGYGNHGRSHEKRHGASHRSTAFKFDPHGAWSRKQERVQKIMNRFCAEKRSSESGRTQVDSAFPRKNSQRSHVALRAETRPRLLARPDCVREC